MKMCLLGLSEVKWLESGNLLCNSHTWIYTEHKKEHNAVSQSVMGYHAMSDKMLLVMIYSKLFYISIIQVYAPTSTNTDEEI